MDIAGAGDACAVERARSLAGVRDVAVRSGPGWLAMRSGVMSNDLNVVLSDRGFLPGPPVLGDLRHWFGDLPTSWLATDPDAALTRLLVDDGWLPERTGRWCGRSGLSVTGGDSDVDLVRVTDQSELTQWLDVAAACGWCEDDADRAALGALLQRYAEDPRRAAWVARVADRPVGMATAWCAGSTVEVVDVGVREEARRRGVGRASVDAVLSWGAARGARDVVAAPSPDGWRLFESLGFDNVPVVPDVCFYRG